MWRPVGMWYDAALNRTVRNIFSSLWKSVGRERLLRAASTSCLYLSQLAFFMLTYIRRSLFICNLIRIGKGSELSVDKVFQENEGC